MHWWRSRIAIKSVVAVALVASGFCAVKRSVAIAVARADPVMALSISSNDARILAGASQVLIGQAQTDRKRREAMSLALAAFKRDGTQVPAITTLGIFQGFARNDRLGADWFAYSAKLSRRDFRTQLYFIEKLAADGDVAGTLSHYDTALRASESAQTILFPILRSAIVNAPVRDELAKILARRPLWADQFLTDAAAYGPDFAAATQLLVDARRLGAAVSPTDDGLLLNNLVLINQIPLAWRYYVGLHPAAMKGLLRNEKFASTGVIETPFDWQLLPGTGRDGRPWCRRGRSGTRLPTGIDGVGARYPPNDCAAVRDIPLDERSGDVVAKSGPRPLLGIEVHRWSRGRHVGNGRTDRGLA